jgi:two-component system, LuxR family, response regulator FixJ
MKIMVEIIDDDEAVRDSTQALLESYGYEVRAHASAEHFLREKGENPDCLLVDHHMPGMSGLDLLELLRSRGDSTPALMLTGHTDACLEPQAQKVGAALLYKPVSEEQLVCWIETAKKANP